ncbi:AAA family ATPase [Bacillus mangrovi]|uniref:Shikimate kinase n=1 Tax=Metabacillus mangrovi TaxID=1491830 RepID=A0A7X2S2A4_9BACI|nr:shikimate kinase [Metabacillus mangrovi]MTH52397.1 AAA family ATPase [Metabacillus mangrovi]
MKNIILTGFMGAGKTTAGAALGGKLQLPVYDTDHLIENEHGLTIREIFQSHGEQLFREMETQLLGRLPSEPAVITTGGGIVMRAENRELLKRAGTVFFLSCPFDEIYERLKEDSTRPLLYEKTKEEIRQLYESRIPFYRDGSIEIDTSGKTPEEVADCIISSLG